MTFWNDGDGAVLNLAQISWIEIREVRGDAVVHFGDQVVYLTSDALKRLLTRLKNG